MWELALYGTIATGSEVPFHSYIGGVQGLVVPRSLDDGSVSLVMIEAGRILSSWECK